MEHQLHHAGVDEARIVQDAIALGRPIPKRIANPPELKPGLEFFLQAFFDLTSVRAVGMGEGPIPWTAMRQWCDEMAAEGDLRQDVFFYVRCLDLAYLKFKAAKMKHSGV